jgi:hypothetical protein
MKVNNRKVRKFKGGGADMGDPGRAQERADRGYGSTAGVDRSKVSATQESNHQKSIASAKASNQQTTTPKTGFNINPVTTGLNLVGSLTANIPGLGFAFDVGKKAVQGVQKATRTQTAKGETIFGNTQPGSKGMPITRDYYRTAGKPLDVMSPQGSQYMKDAGFLKGPKTTTDGGGGEDNICPDGTNPPCKLPTTQIKQPVSTPNTFLSGFKAYDDGGEVIISSNVDKSLL